MFDGSSEIFQSVWGFSDCHVIPASNGFCYECHWSNLKGSIIHYSERSHKNKFTLELPCGVERVNCQKSQVGAQTALSRLFSFLGGFLQASLRSLVPLPDRFSTLHLRVKSTTVFFLTHSSDSSLALPIGPLVTSAVPLGRVLENDKSKWILLPCWPPL